jgi:OFA family oxalate/formate antiporter-like MFS transporter
LKWFPDRRGLAAGIDGGGLRRRLGPDGRADCQHDSVERIRIRFLWFGLGQGLIVVLVAQMMRAPAAGEVCRAGRQPSADAARLHAGPVLATPVFWIMYAMFVMVGAGG